jgi:hypothetical protein
MTRFEQESRMGFTPDQLGKNWQEGFHPVPLPGIEKPMAQLVKGPKAAAEVLNAASRVVKTHLLDSGTDPTTVDLLARGLEKRTGALTEDLFSDPAKARTARVEAFRLIERAGTLVTVFDRLR